MRALIFDLDGTLIDTVYAHVLAWQRVFAEAGIRVPAYLMHPRVGMHGALFVSSVLREVGAPVDEETSRRLRDRHGQVFYELLPERAPLPGARELLEALESADVPYAVATSGKPDAIRESLAALGLGDDSHVIDGEGVERGKPDPEAFLKAAEKLGTPPAECVVVGDSVWDFLAARRAGMEGVGLLTGGNDRSELTAAGCSRIYHDPAELHRALEEIGIEI
jgi:HAD superfamily hydrolase (TIGR01509 family)